MPTLVVHTRQLQDARDFLREIGVQAELVPFEGRERQPKDDDVPRIAGAEVAFIGVRRQYVRAAEADLGCRTVCRLETVRGGRVALLDWLRPQVQPRLELLAPRAAFEAAARDEPRLILADGALDTADFLVETLHSFAHKAASALQDYAREDARAPMGLERFFAERGVTFASSGGRAFRWRVVDGSGREVAPLTPKQHKHLKQGDRKNTPEECARIYFGSLDQCVVVARCGPHPSSDFDVVVRKTR